MPEIPNVPAVITIGETMVQFNPFESGRLSQASVFEKFAAGSESNVAIGLSRLGITTAHITKLGKDEFSAFILAALRSETVWVDWVHEIEGKHCGIYFVQRDFPFPGQADVIYYRSDSAARELAVEDIRSAPISLARILHTSGITLALSNSCRDACFEAISIAKNNGVIFSFDTNFRKKLWSAAEAAPVLKKAATSADILFTGPEDARILLGHGSDYDSMVDELLALGPKTVVLKLGEKGGIVARTAKERATSPSLQVKTVDPIGAGDAVVVGYLASELWNKPLQEKLDMASICAALVVSRRGDYQNLPNKSQLEAALSSRNLGIDPR